MANDISLAVGDGARRMTYAELAEARAISLPSARRLVLRHHWPRQKGNDGIVRVTVPLTALENAKESAGSAVTTTTATVSHATDPLTPAGDTATDPLTVTLSRAVDLLREQLVIANVRADQAEARVADRDFTIDHLRAEIRSLLDLLTVRRSWWRRWFR